MRNVRDIGFRNRGGKLIYYIGDMHLGHKNVIKYDDRPFETVEEMDSILIENWNSVVSDDDDVYIIGDFIYRSSNIAVYYLEQLKGHKHLIIGNHDLNTIEDEKACAYFDSIERLGYVKDGTTDVVMCHYPIAEWNGKRRKKNRAYHVYSHLHNRRDAIYDFMKYQCGALNAGCMINNYTPATLSQLIENNQSFVQIDPMCARRNFEIFAKLRADLNPNELEYVTEKINELKEKYKMSEQDGVFYKTRICGGNDVGPGNMFLIGLRKYRSYFESITYNSYLEGVVGVKI